jgi:predicted DCC family thiol-disulfide oxidoreductase YuxK
LFDGVWALCNAAVQFIIGHDPDARLQFAPSSSRPGAGWTPSREVDPAASDTVVFIEHDRALVMSDAVLAIARERGAPWSWPYGLSIVPRRVRDAACGSSPVSGPGGSASSSHVPSPHPT